MHSFYYAFYAGMERGMLRVEHLSKLFHGFRLEDVSFELPDGYIMGIIGENGSGKSTLLRCILDIYEEDNGVVVFDKGDVRDRATGLELNAVKENRIDSCCDEVWLKSNIAVVLEQSMYEENMSCMDNARIAASINKKFDTDKFLQECEYWGIKPKNKVKSMSKGMQMKFQIAMAFAHNPKLLIMDEPTANLDEETRKRFRQRMLDFVNDGTRSVLISSHIMGELESISDYILYLHEGKVIFNEDRESLLDRFLLVSGERYKIKLLPEKYIIGMEEQSLTTRALIRKSNIYKPDISLVVQRPKLEDLMYYINLADRNALQSYVSYV